MKPGYKQVQVRRSTGKAFDLLNPKPEMIAPEDIAHALSKLCRFTGHCRFFYTVERHCLHVSERVSPEFALQGLLHDAAEAYIGDINAPLKRALGDALRPIETAIEQAVRDRFGLPGHDWPQEVYEADLRMLATEKRDLMDQGLDWKLPDWAKPYPDLFVWGCGLGGNGDEFLARLYRLLSERKC